MDLSGILKVSDRQAILRTTMLYSFVGGIWFLAANRLFAILTADLAPLSAAYILPDIVFGAISSVVVYALLRLALQARDRALAVLTDEHNLLRTMIDYLPDYIFIKDAAGHYILSNKAHLQQRGLTSLDEMIGKSDFDYFPAELATQYRHDEDQIFRTGQPLIDREEPTLDPTGARIWVSTTKVPLRDASGKITGLVGIVHNVTEYKLITEALQNARDELEVRVAELSEANRLLQREIFERKRIESAEHDQRALAEALRDTAAALNSTLDFEEVLERILANVKLVVPSDLSNIMLIESGVARVVRLSGYEEIGAKEHILRLRLPVAETANLRWMCENKRALVIPDVQAYPGWIVHTDWVRSYVGVPIRLDQEVIGFLSLDSATTGYFTDEHARRLQAFTDQAAIAIQNARLYEQAQDLAVLQERQRLARELHDAVSQTLFSASVMAEALPRLAERNPSRVKQGLVELHHLTRGALAEMRTLLFELRPAGLVETPLEDLLRQLVEGIAGRTEIHVSLVIENRPTVPPEVQVALYRIVQEALNNVARHARATEATVTLRGDPRTVQIRISDNGRGFDLESVPPDHFGLAIMHERASSVGARLTIESTIGGGTAVVVEWSEI